jgi:hypothetical protein
MNVKKIPKGRRGRWIMELQQYKFDIIQTRKRKQECRCIIKTYIKDGIGSLFKIKYSYKARKWMKKNMTRY